MFALCIKMPIDPSDGYPDRICQQCAASLRVFGKFHNSVMRVHEQQTSVLQSVRHSAVQTTAETLQTDVTWSASNCVGDVTIETDRFRDVQPMEEIYLDEEYLDDDDATTSPAAAAADDVTEPSLYPVGNPEQQLVPVTAPSKSQPHRPHRCITCRSTFASERALQRHICAVGKVTYGCSVCGQRFRSLTAVDEHELRHEQLRPFGCTQCDRTFKTPTDLWLHKRIHDAAERKYQCEHCDYSTRNRTHIVHHLNWHAGVKPYACPVCDRRFRRREYMHEHRQAMHADATAPRYQCTECDAHFGLAYRLKVSVEGAGAGAYVDVFDGNCLDFSVT